MPPIFMISGWCGSGKDLIADYLVQTRGYTKFSVAAELKQMVAYKYNVEYNATQTQEGKKTIVTTATGQKTIRDLLIEEALNQKRQLGDNVFISATAKKIDNIIETTHGIVIPDFRFKHEYEFMHNKYTSDIVTIRINRFDKPPVISPSETELDNFKFDHVIDNRTDKQSVYRQIEAILTRRELQQDLQFC